jgi:hypothetical protein
MMEGRIAIASLLEEGEWVVTAESKIIFSARRAFARAWKETSFNAQPSRLQHYFESVPPP